MIPDGMQIQAKKEYCFPAVIEILLKFYGYCDIDQCVIAQKLCELTGQDATSFIQDGLQIRPGTLNTFFEENNFKLKEQYISCSKIYDEYDFECKLKEQCEQDSFIICGYNYSWLFDKRCGTANHVSVICSVNSESEKITIFDPGPEDYGHKEVKIDDLWYALKIARAGIWCVQPLKGRE